MRQEQSPDSPRGPATTAGQKSPHDLLGHTKSPPSFWGAALPGTYLPLLVLSFLLAKHPRLSAQSFSPEFPHQPNCSSLKMRWVHREGFSHCNGRTDHLALPVIPCGFQV